MTEPQITPMDQMIARVRKRLEPLLERQATMDLSVSGGGAGHPTEVELRGLGNSDLAVYVDHTLLRADATAGEIDKLCDEALRFRFFAVCVNPDRVAQCAARLGKSRVRVATVVGFPLGATSTAAKVYEAREALAAGAQELDMVINLGRLKDGEFKAVLADISAVTQAAAPRLVKVIIEAGLLTADELTAACLLAQAAEAGFVKTSTGTGAIGARVSDVRAMRQVVGAAMGVKASGGIGDAKTARAMLAAGANRLGTSKSVAIVGEA